MGFLKKIFSRKPRQIQQPGFPLEIKTSERMTSLTVTHARGQKESIREPLYLLARCKGTTSPKNQFWEVTQVLPKCTVPWVKGAEIVLENATYEKAMECLKSYELEICRAAGMTGTDEEIIAARSPYVPDDNVLKFYEIKQQPVQQKDDTAAATDGAGAVLKEDLHINPPLRLKK